MSSGLVRMLLFLSIRLYSGGVSLFLKTILFIFLELLLYICWHFDTIFCYTFVGIVDICLL